MQCCACGNEGVGEPGSFAYFVFGAVRTGREGRDKGAERAAQRILRKYRTHLVFGWHGADWDETAPYADTYAHVEMNEDHPQLPKPALVDLQTEFDFCSTECLRAWLNAAVDLLEKRREAAASGEDADDTDDGCVNPILTTDDPPE